MPQVGQVALCCSQMASDENLVLFLEIPSKGCILHINCLMQLLWPDDSGFQDYLSGPFSPLSSFSYSHQYWPNSECETQIIPSTLFFFHSLLPTIPSFSQVHSLSPVVSCTWVTLPHLFWLKLLTFFNATSFRKPSMHSC